MSNDQNVCQYKHKADAWGVLGYVYGDVQSAKKFTYKGNRSPYDAFAMTAGMRTKGLSCACAPMKVKSDGSSMCA